MKNTILEKEENSPVETLTDSDRTRQLRLANARLKDELGVCKRECERQVVRNQYLRNELSEKFISQGATPSGVLTKEEKVADGDEWRKFKGKFHAEYAGRKKLIDSQKSLEIPADYSPWEKI